MRCRRPRRASRRWCCRRCDIRAFPCSRRQRRRRRCRSPRELQSSAATKMLPLRPRGSPPPPRTRRPACLQGSRRGPSRTPLCARHNSLRLRSTRRPRSTRRARTRCLRASRGAGARSQCRQCTCAQCRGSPCRRTSRRASSPMQCGGCGSPPRSSRRKGRPRKRPSCRARRRRRPRCQCVLRARGYHPRRQSSQ